jgi:L-lactate dehydrogenase complex protein LldF
MKLTANEFKSNARDALDNASLQRALGNVERGFIEKRAKAVAKLPEFDALRDNARDIKNHTLAHLDLYLEPSRRRCWPPAARCTGRPTAEEAREHVVDICRRGRHARSPRARA